MVSHNDKMGNPVGIEFASALKENQSLTYLSLSQIGLTDTDESDSVVGGGGGGWWRWAVEERKGFGYEISAGLSANRTLLVLSLDRNNLDDITGVQLAKAMKNNNTLVRLQYVAPVPNASC